jgi:hypothetical protein
MPLNITRSIAILKTHFVLFRMWGEHSCPPFLGVGSCCTEDEQVG